MKENDKVLELLEKYLKLVEWQINYNEMFKKAKECALVTVSEILYLMISTLKWDEKTNGNIHYWQEVKAQIEKL